MTDDEYRFAMWGPMERLATEIWGAGGNAAQQLSKPEIVDAATKRIKTLKEMILATGFNRDMLNLIMREL